MLSSSSFGPRKRYALEVVMAKESKDVAPKSPKEIVHAWFDRVWNAGDESAIDAFFSSTGIAHGLPTPDGKPMQGAAAFKPFFLNFRSAFPDIKVTVDQCVTEGNLCAVHCTVTGTHTGDGLGSPATGRRVLFSGMTMIRVEHGKIQEGWNTYDFLSVYQQLGLLPRLTA
jgi:steroid delta-isomerase-like uncharacterized protein